MKRHYPGAVYELTAENMNGLIEQLEEHKERARKLSESRNRQEDRARLAMEQLAKAEGVLTDLASWSLDVFVFNKLSINGRDNGILQAREYFYEKLGAE